MSEYFTHQILQNRLIEKQACLALLKDPLLPYYFFYIMFFVIRYFPLIVIVA